MNPGFYKLENETLHYAPNYVLDAHYQLHKETHHNHTYPIDGWHWFNTQQEAHQHFGIVESDQPVE